jgi:hypothetical protein
MDKNAIKKFAVWARRELISRVSQRAAWYGITEKDPIDEKLQAIHGHVLTPEEQAQRRALIWHIRKNGYQQVMEEVAYTWFNRFIALRFMEVNGYLPSYTRVFSDENGAFNPQILKDAIHLDIDGLDMEKVYAMEEANETEALFKYLVITQCNDLNRMLPGMFQKISDYTELLFPDFLLREGSVAHQMVTTIPEEDWKDAVQIIGWLCQYYNAEPKDEVFAALKKNIKISKEKIPAATQLFTPDWIVRYMVENSLGRLWVEGHPNDELKANWKYYLEEAQQEPEVEAQLKKIRAEYAQIDPASILCADPCMGSGHILVYMFDVLMQIYLAYGYTTNEAVESIVQNNLWGMDIDDRAAQLAYFAVMMKAQQYDKRWLAKQVRHPVQPNVFALQDSGDWPTFERQMRQSFTHHPSLFADPAIKTAKALFDAFADAKEFGSIIQPEVTLEELTMLENELDEMTQKADLMDFVVQVDANTLLETLKPLILQARGLVQKYHAVVTNPPYMGNGGMPPLLSEFVRAEYPDTKTDMSTVFMERNLILCNHLGFVGMINIPVWMFLSSFENMRATIVAENTYINMLHFGRGVFGSDFGTTSFIIGKQKIPHYQAKYYKLFERQGAVDALEVKERWFFERKGQYIEDQDNYLEIPGVPVAYSLGRKLLSAFASKNLVSSVADVKQGLATGENNRFLRFWWEVRADRVCYGAHSSDEALQSLKKWFPYNKGGAYRKWYGNIDYIVNWENDGYEIKNIRDEKGKLRSRPQNLQYFFKEALTWSKVTIGGFSMRYVPYGAVFDVAGCSLFPHEKLHVLLANMNSCVQAHILSVFSQSVNYEVGQIAALPVIDNASKDAAIEGLAIACIDISKAEWDSFETSNEYTVDPLVWLSRGIWDGTLTAANLQEFYGELPQSSCPLETCYLLWQGICNQRFNQLKANEEELNRIFIDIYGLQDELTPDVADKDVTVRKADRDRDIRSLISYAVGCMMGRYSLDKPGLVLAGQKFTNVYAHNPEGYQYGDLTTLEGDYLIQDAEKKDYLKCTFAPDWDGILPITDDEYFDDDIVGMFVNWVRTVFGADSLEDNLKYIADTLGGKGNPRDVIRQYFLNDFYKDHLKIYQKRPIYWLFDSGKKNGFKCLIYMQRYQPDTIARIRTDYLHETQARYRNAIETLERQSANASTGERVKMTKRLNALKAQAEEARVYEEKIHHLADQMIKIDLDDGVKVNYAKFADVLAPIK